MPKKWIQDALGKSPIKHHEGRVGRYLKRVYGNKAFFNDGTIKKKYIDKAIDRIKEGEGRDYKGLLQALYFTKTLKKFSKLREVV